MTHNRITIDVDGNDEAPFDQHPTDDQTIELTAVLDPYTTCLHCGRTIEPTPTGGWIHPGSRSAILGTVGEKVYRARPPAVPPHELCDPELVASATPARGIAPAEYVAWADVEVHEQHLRVSIKPAETHGRGWGQPATRTEEQAAVAAAIGAEALRMTVWVERDPYTGEKRYMLSVPAIGTDSEVRQDPHDGRHYTVSRIG